MAREKKLSTGQNLEISQAMTPSHEKKLRLEKVRTRNQSRHTPEELKKRPKEEDPGGPTRIKREKKRDGIQGILLAVAATAGNSV